MGETDIVCHLLLTLPKSFDNLVTAYETIDPMNLTVDFAKSRILDEFQKRTSIVATKNVDSVAMNVGRNKPKEKCFNCGKSVQIRYSIKTSFVKAPLFSIHNYYKSKRLSVPIGAAIKTTTNLRGVGTFRGSVIFHHYIFLNRKWNI